MGELRTEIERVFRDYAVDGVVSSGPHDPIKAEIRDALGRRLELVLSAIGSGIKRFATIAARNADTASDDGALAFVYLNNGATDDPLNGVYQWKGGTSEWVAAPWYFDAVAAIVEPLVNDAEAARDEAQAIADQLSTSVDDERRARWDAMLAQLNAGNVQPGIIDLADYGIDDWPNTWGVLLYWTGSVLYPLKKVEDGFNEGWRDGDIVHQEASGDLYYSVSIPKLHDPTLDASLTVTAYHQNWQTGTDDLAAGRGDTEGNPWKSLAYALTQAVANGDPFVIHSYGDLLGSNSLTNTVNIVDGLKGKIHFHPVNRPLTWRIGQRENITNASFAWTSLGGGTWKSAVAATSIPDAVKKTYAMADARNVDGWGMPTPLKYLGTGASEAAVITAVKAFPGSHGWYGTTGTGLSLIVHTLDGLEPDPQFVWSIEGAPATTWSIGEDALLYIENLGTFMWNQGTNISGVRARPIAVDVGTRVEHTGSFWMHSFAVLGASGCGVQIYDIARYGWDYGTIKWVLQDGENIHSFYATSANAGDYMEGWTSFMKIDYCGMTLHGNPPAAGGSNQVSSVHDQARHTRANYAGGFTRGAVVADVLGAQTWSLNCHVGSPVQGAGADSPETAFWCDGALGGPAGSPLSKMALWNCSGRGVSATFSATLGGTIEHAKQIGEITSAVSDGGTVTNLD